MTAAAHPLITSASLANQWVGSHKVYGDSHGSLTDVKRVSGFRPIRISAGSQSSPSSCTVDARQICVDGLVRTRDRFLPEEVNTLRWTVLVSLAAFEEICDGVRRMDGDIGNGGV
ncbi:hypothetical protein EYF80_047021 [Liparis tanakae]|uniref:Uncharacterized protein n=1 Tax=Liparis tanakae TaxID=230148 RepID=A0A4Z2FPH1_9TELE|nr:hypothetical protein EYF80_047021 [Liparis tanakae]